MKFKKIIQEHPMGCGIACVAAVLGKSYRAVLKACPNPEYAWTRGFYCSELVDLLSQHGQAYKWRRVRSDHDAEKIMVGSIVFLAPCLKYPYGHFLLKTSQKSFMNPWSNCPSMRAVRARFQSQIGPITHVIEPK